MAASRGRRSRESVASAMARRKGSHSRMSINQRRLFRKLLHILAEIVDEKGHFETDDDTIDSILDEAESEDEKSRLSCDRRQPTRQRKARDNDKNQEHYEAKHVSRFLKLVDTHGQLTYHIRTLLNALGGGGRTAEALEKMHAVIAEIAKNFEVGNEEVQIYYPSYCSELLDGCKTAVAEVQEALQELGLFNTTFFYKLQAMMRQLGVLSAKLDAEYGRCSACCVDQYLDDIFEPLVRDFDSFISGLTNIAEKEIWALRQAQDFSSQRYLNLTTVATFLSSTTATTLQITAEEAGSALTAVTNTLWFTSLVFSTSSAVYSLLVMTWSQSSVCQPNLALSSSFYSWFRNGPMFSLVGALLTFSIGLCLLAFQVGDQQGFLPSAAVPTTFAGINAYAILVLAVWFLSEQWKRKRVGNYVGNQYLVSLKRIWRKRTSVIKARARSAKRRFMELSASFIVRAPPFKSHDATAQTPSDKDQVINIGIDHSVTASPIMIVVDESIHDPPSLSTSEKTSEEVDTQMTKEPQRYMNDPEGKSIVNPDDLISSTNGQLGVKHINETYERLIQFSPNGRFLALAHNSTVTVYDLESSCSMLETIRIPGNDEVNMVSWFPSYPSQLLVKSRRSVSVWRIRDDFERHGEMLGYLKEVVTSVKCTNWLEAGIEGFICVTGPMVRLFSKTCKKLRTIDISRLCRINRVVDAAMLQNNYLLCIAEVPDDPHSSRLLLIDFRDSSIQSSQLILRGHTSITMSHVSKNILLHGSKAGPQIAELIISESGERVLVDVEEANSLRSWTHDDHELYQPTRAVVFHGHQDKMIIGYSGDEIVTLYREHGDPSFIALHIFTTTNSEAIPRRPVGFAVNAGSDSNPYMFAFIDECGTGTIWSVQSNTDLDKCPSARRFEVHDRRGGRSGIPVTINGSFLLLPTPT